MKYKKGDLLYSIEQSSRKIEIIGFNFYNIGQPDYICLITTNSEKIFKTYLSKEFIETKWKLDIVSIRKNKLNKIWRKK